MRNALNWVWDVVVFVGIVLIGLIFFTVVWTQSLRQRGRITL